MWRANISCKQLEMFKICMVCIKKSLIKVVPHQLDFKLIIISWSWVWTTNYIIGKMLYVHSWQDVHFRSVESSWRKSSELLVEIASHGEDTGFEVPCLIVAAKDDLDSFPMAIQESTRVFLLNCSFVLLCAYYYA